jgi:hypothetical protein
MSEKRSINDINFKNLFAVKRTTIFYVFFDKLTSTYDDLVVILPNILGNNLPNFFKKIRTFYY